MVCPHRRGGGAILHHRHITAGPDPRLVAKMDGITATIWASQTTNSTGRCDNLERDVGT